MDTARTATNACSSSIFLPELATPRRLIAGRQFDFDRQIAVMAIVNRTPDSFYDRGRTFALGAAIESGRSAWEAGADWVDIGGVKFAPGPAVPVDEELDRIVPVVEALRQIDGLVISIDTFQPAVAAAGIRAGANVINDTTGLADPEMARVVADSGAQVVITHSLAVARNPHPKPTYHDVVAEVLAHLGERVQRARDAGIPDEQIIIDPGHDLNKNTLHSLEVTRRFAEFSRLGLPTLAAVSNKDFIGETLDREQGRRLEGSLAVAVICILNGARIVRMHDVDAAVAAVRMTEAVLGFREPAYLHHNRE